MQALASQPTTNKYRFYQAPSSFVSRHWDSLSYMLLQSLPAHVVGTPEVDIKLLDAVVKEQLQVWLAMCGEGNKKGELVGVFSTFVSSDAITGTKRLVIYTITGIGRVDTRVVTEALEKLKLYAKGRGCKAIIGQAIPGPLSDRAEAFGAATQKVAVWEI